MMRLLLFGNKGQIGWELERCLSALGEVTALDFPQVDFTNLVDLRRVTLEARPEVIINAAAYTAVDQAEKEPETAMLINGQAPGVLAEAARACGAALVHYSTEYVFDGRKAGPYTENDQPNPLNAYAAAKAVGDQAVSSSGAAFLILRSSWVYSLRRDNFVARVLKWARTQPVIRIVTDQVGAPTWARTLAELTALVLVQGSHNPADWISERSGIYNVTCSGHTSRYGWAQEILAHDPHPEEQIAKQLLPALTSDFPSPAHRPLNSVLDCTRFCETFRLNLPHWRDILHLALRQ